MTPADSPDRSGAGKKQPKSQRRRPEQPEDAAQPSDPQQPSDSEHAEPLNRAERRAQRRGKRPSAPGSGGPVQQPRHAAVVPRRASRRGNR